MAAIGLQTVICVLYPLKGGRGGVVPSRHSNLAGNDFDFSLSSIYLICRLCMNLWMPDSMSDPSLKPSIYIDICPRTACSDFYYEDKKFSE